MRDLRLQAERRPCTRTSASSTATAKPDHPLLRYTRAYLYDDGEALREYAPEAVAWLRSHGEDDAAVHAEIGGVASALMSTGHFAELDAFVSALVDRYRSQGPPTLLYVTLAMLGYSALFQGRPDDAERLFDECRQRRGPRPNQLRQRAGLTHERPSGAATKHKHSGYSAPTCRSCSKPTTPTLPGTQPSSSST